MDNNEKKYIDRATDILADLVRESRSKLPSPEKEAANLSKELASLGKLDKVFKENSRKLIEMIEKKRNKNR